MKKLLLLFVPLMLLTACGEVNALTDNSELQKDNGTQIVKEERNIVVRPDDYRFITYRPKGCSYGSGGGCWYGEISFLNVENIENIVLEKDVVHGNAATTSKALNRFHYTGFRALGNGSFEPLDGEEWLTQEEFLKEYIPFSKKHESINFFCNDYGFGNKVIRENVDVLMVLDRSGNDKAYVIQDGKGNANLLSDTCQRIVEHTKY